MAKKQKSEPSAGSKVICKNRRAKHDYDIEDRLEVGLVLRGSEVKSCRDGQASLNEAYVKVMTGEVFLIGAHIAEYKQSGPFNHEPTRTRKLLLHRKQIDRLEVRLRQQGRTAMPLALYLKDGRIKLEIGVGKGRSHADRRHVLKEREMNREIQRTMRRR